jgi:hypothetical protein
LRGRKWLFSGTQHYLAKSQEAKASYSKWRESVKESHILDNLRWNALYKMEDSLEQNKEYKRELSKSIPDIKSLKFWNRSLEGQGSEWAIIYYWDITFEDNSIIRIKTQLRSTEIDLSSGLTAMVIRAALFKTVINRLNRSRTNPKQ